jgi:soluble lytic murein transglycosylase-like protein
LKTLILITLILLAGCDRQEPAWAEVDLKIIASIESNNNANAFNKSSGAVGMYQITQPALSDFNKAHKRQYQLSEMFDPLKAEIVARWYLNSKIPAYLRHYGIADTLENRLWAYNAGIGRVKQGIMPRETKEYIKRYKRLVY